MGDDDDWRGRFEELRGKYEALESELESVRAVAAALELNHEEIVRDVVRQKDEEIQSVHAVYRVSNDDSASVQLEMRHLVEENSDLQRRLSSQPTTASAEQRDTYSDDLYSVQLQLSQANHENIRLTKLLFDKTETNSAPSEDCTECSKLRVHVEHAAKELRASERSCEQLGDQLQAEQEENEKLRSKLERLIAQFHTLDEESKKDSLQIEELTEQVRSLTENALHEPRRLRVEMTQLHKDLRKMREDKSKLLGAFQRSADALQNEEISLPACVDDLQLEVLKFRELLIQERFAKEHLLEDRNNEIITLKDVARQSTSELNAMDAEYSKQLDEGRRLLEAERAKSRSNPSNLHESSSADNMAQVAELVRSNTSLKLQLDVVQKQFNELSLKRDEAEKSSSGTVQELRHRVSKLQIELNNSEAVQLDFVKLSQSLQMKLEELRGDSVRWQFEDEILDCQHCRRNFSPEELKSRCYHCVKIFCHNCCSRKAVAGVTGREVPVCDVCHTILDSNAKPFYSTDVPGIS